MRREEKRALMVPRVARLNALIHDGRILRQSWVEFNGLGDIERACLLVALAPETVLTERYLGQSRVDMCPAYIMPKWMASLTTFIDDAGSPDNWPFFIQRYANVAARIHAITSNSWKTINKTICGFIVAETIAYTKTLAEHDDRCAGLLEIATEMGAKINKGIKIKQNYADKIQECREGIFKNAVDHNPDRHNFSSAVLSIASLLFSFIDMSSDRATMSLLQGAIAGVNRHINIDCDYEAELQWAADGIVDFILSTIEAECDRALVK